MILAINILYHCIAFLLAAYYKKRFIYIMPLVMFGYDALNIILGENLPFTAIKIPLYLFALTISFSSLLFKFKSNIWIYVFIIYLVITFPLSEYYQYSFQGLIQLYLSFIMFLVGYYWINNTDKLRYLNYSFAAILGLFIINFIVSNTFNLGEDLYGLFILNGSLHREHTYIASLCIVLVPLNIYLSKSKSYKYYLIITAIICAVILILLMRRGAIVLFLIGLSVIAYRIYFNKIKYIFSTLPILIIMGFLAYTYSGDILERFYERGVAMDDPLEEFERTGRTMDIVEAFKEALSFDDIKKSLIGTQDFYFTTTVGHFTTFRKHSTIHATIALIVHGMGLIGLILFLMIFVNIIYKYITNTRHLRNNDFGIILLKATFLALFAMSIFDFYTKSFFYNTYAPTLFLYMGGILKILHTENKKIVKMKYKSVN